MSETRKDIRDEIYSMIGEPSDSTGEFDESRLNSKINTMQSMVCKGGIVSLITEQPIEAPDLRFLRKKQYITWITPAKLTADVVSGDTILYLDTTRYSASGDVSIEGEIAHYTGKSVDNLSLTGVTGITTTHASGKEVRQVYKYPTDCYKPFGIEYINNDIPNAQTYVDDKDFRSDRDSRRFYMTIGDGSTTDNYIDIYGYDNGEKFINHYYKNPTAMATDAATTDLPENYGTTVIAPLVAGMLLYTTDEQNTGLGLLKLGYMNLQTMYGQYANTIKRYRPKVKTASINRGQVYGKYYRRS